MKAFAAADAIWADVPSTVPEFLLIQLDIAGSARQPRIVVRNRRGDTIDLPALWLRERAQDASQVDATTGQRLIDPHLLPPDLKLVEARRIDDRLQLSFSDGYRGTFDPAPLIEDIAMDDGCPEPAPWHAGAVPECRVAWPDIEGDEAAMAAALERFLVSGFLVLTGTPRKADATLEIAGRFGTVRETNFGRRFEVVSRPGSNDLAYRPVRLGPHTDNPYRVPVPGIQILHCLENGASGGLSTLADSLAAAALLRDEDPDGFALLAEIPVRFRFRDEGADHVALRPVIETDGEERMTGLHYSPRLDSLPLLEEAELQAYQAARKRLAELLAGAELELRFALQPGELLMFDNNRIVHGRTAFDPEEGPRRLIGCYIDRDGPRSLYRMLGRNGALHKAA